MATEKNGVSKPLAFTVVIEPDAEDGGYVVHCPDLKECWSQGETIDEAMHNIVDAMSGWLATHIERSLDQARRSANSELLTHSLTSQVQTL